jgi:hypothetical protein
MRLLPGARVRPMAYALPRGQLEAETHSPTFTERA